MLHKTSIALSIALLIAGSNLNLAFAQGAEEAPSDMDGAKGLFFEQLSKPQQPLNTGLRYWIQLNRNGASRRATSRETFRTGDHIQFHVCPNIDGYAYIVLKTVTTGEEAVLFPQKGESNKVEHGKDYVLPGDGSLVFDQNPGTEKLTLLLSRNRIDPKSFLSKPSAQVIQIASSKGGSKDLVPAQVMVVDSNTGSSESLKGLKGGLVAASLTDPVKPAHRKPPKPASGPKKSPERRANASGDETAVTTIVRTVPTGVLFVDVALDHE